VSLDPGVPGAGLLAPEPAESGASISIAPGIRAAFTVRAGGISLPPFDSLNLGLHVGDDPAAVVENRRRALRALHPALDIDDLVVAEQVHGAGVHVVAIGDRGRGARSLADAIPATDAMVTSAPRTCLAVLVADCVPVLLADPVAGCIAAAHAGWRGIAAGVIERVVMVLENQLGARAEHLVALVGPSIGPGDYPVGAEVVEAVGPRHALTISGERVGIDLRHAVRSRLEVAGVPSAAIRLVDGGASTASATDRYYSYRAANPGPTGRFAGLICLGLEARA